MKKRKSVQKFGQTFSFALLVWYNKVRMILRTVSCLKLFHLSDLHLGIRLNEVSLIEDQRHILEQILDYVRSERPDGIILAGDIYDRSVPSEEAVNLYDSFMTELARLKVYVFVISGNHDSASRLSCCSRLISGCGIYVSGSYNGEIQKIELQDQYGAVNIYLLPFVKPAMVKHFLEEAEAVKIESYHDAVAKVVTGLAVDSSQRNVIVTHQFVTGAERCDSEDVSVGGTDNIAAEVFADFDYVALGHIHGPQWVGGQERIRYCGTPLKYSFSEAGQEKSITVVELGEKGQLEIKLLPLKPVHDLRILRGKYEELMLKENYEGTNRDDYLKIILTDEDEVPNVMNRLRTVYKNILQLEYDNTRTRNSENLVLAENVRLKSELELFAEFFEKQNGRTLAPEQEDYLRDLIEALKEADS